jgi:hypothetical protein
MIFSRRSFFARMIPGLAGAAVASAAIPISAKANDANIQKVVYHLSEAERINFVLGNIKNHIAGKGGPDKVRIVLVIHGPALAAFLSSKASPDVAIQVRKRSAEGASFIACGNTMKAQKIQLADLLPGFDVAAEGGVVRIADLQDAGYAYLRP